MLKKENFSIKNDNNDVVRAVFGRVYDYKFDDEGHAVKVAASNPPLDWDHKKHGPYLIGAEFTNREGLWIPFYKNITEVLKDWQPAKGDGVIVWIFGKPNSNPNKYRAESFNLSHTKQNKKDAELFQNGGMMFWANL